MFLPVQNKPSVTTDYTNLITIVPNILTRELADKLKEFVKNTQVSGWHRRGSKNKYTKASFFTCLVLQHNVPIYDVLDKAWEHYIKTKKPNISFVEPYELKLYVKGDSFGFHNDIQISSGYDIERKINLLIQLSDEIDYEGGDLYIGEVRCPKTFGTGVFFPAKYTHCVTEVTYGERFSLIGHAWGPLDFITGHSHYQAPI